MKAPVSPEVRRRGKRKKKKEKKKRKKMTTSSGNQHPQAGTVTAPLGRAATDCEMLQEARGAAQHQQGGS